MTSVRYRHCPACGSEFQERVERCLDCDVPLGSPVSGDVPPPTQRAEGDGRPEISLLDVAHLTSMERERLELLLRGADLRFEMDDARLWVPQGSTSEADVLLTSVRAQPARADATRRRSPSTSRVRPDRRVVRLECPDVDVPPDSTSFAGIWQRGVARSIDLWIAGVAAGSLTLLPTSNLLLGWSVAVVLLAGGEAMFGATPGKAAVGVRVEALSGGPPSVLAALLRNAWLVLLLIPLVGPYLFMAAQVSIGWLLRRDPMARGPHDIVAETVVMRSRIPIRRRLVAQRR